MNKNTHFEPRNKEFFECDCYDKEHLIRAEYSNYIIKYPDGTKHYGRDLNILFSTRIADYDNLYEWNENIFLKFYHKLTWRIKNAFKILVHGEIITEGYFSPCRSLVDTHKNQIENLFGYQTTKNLAKWLDTKADEIKADYERDCAEYYKNIPGAVESD